MKKEKSEGRDDDGVKSRKRNYKKQRRRTRKDVQEIEKEEGLQRRD